MQTQPSLKRSTLRLFYLSLLLGRPLHRRQMSKPQKLKTPQSLTHQ